MNRSTLRITGYGASLQLCSSAMPRGFRHIGVAALFAASPLCGQTNESSNAGRGAHNGQQQPPDNSTLGASIDNLAREIHQTRNAQNDLYGSERNEREKRDILAQEDMAKSARRTFWATITSAVIAALALIAVGIDVWLNRKRAKIDQRPWLTFCAKLAKSAQFTDKGLKLTFDITVRNVGSTPAINCHLKGKIFNVLRGTDGQSAFIAEHAQAIKASKDVGFIVAPNEEITKSYNIGISRDQFGVLEANDGQALYPMAVFSICYRATSDPAMFGQTAKGILVHNKALARGEAGQIGTGISVVHLNVAEAVNVGIAT